MEKKKTNLTQSSDYEMIANTDDEAEIDLVALFYVLLGNVWKIILCMVIGGGIAFSYTRFLVKPTYTATSKIYVVSASNNSVIDLSDLQLGSQLTSDYQELLLARPVLQDVISNLNLDMSYRQLSGLINISNTTDTRILSIDVTTTNAQLSADIANELVEQAIIYLPKVMETEEPNLVEGAIAPESKAGPSYSKNTMIGMFAGAAIMCAILITRFLMNDTFVTGDDIERYFGTQPLASIPESDAKQVKKAKKKRKKKGGN